VFVDLEDRSLCLNFQYQVLGEKRGFVEKKRDVDDFYKDIIIQMVYWKYFGGRIRVIE